MIPSRIYKADKCWNLDFNGSSGEVGLGNLDEIDGLSAFTVMMWIRPDAFPTYCGLFNKTKGDAAENYLGSVSFAHGPLVAPFSGFFARINTTGADGYVYSSASGILATGTWSHVVMVFDGSLSGNTNRCKIYHNGSSVSLSSGGTIPATLPSPAGAARLGLWLHYTTSASYRWFDGRMSNVALFSRALAQKEIQYWMPRYLTGRETGLIAYYPFLNRTGVTLKDWSNNKINGTITSASWVKGS